MEADVVLAATNRTMSMSARTTAGIKIRLLNMIHSLFVIEIQIQIQNGRDTPCPFDGWVMHVPTS
jgi:hypothetical protein